MITYKISINKDFTKAGYLYKVKVKKGFFGRYKRIGYAMTGERCFDIIKADLEANGIKEFKTIINF